MESVVGRASVAFEPLSFPESFAVADRRSSFLSSFPSSWLQPAEPASSSSHILSKSVNSAGEDSASVSQPSDELGFPSSRSRSSSMLSLPVRFKQPFASLIRRPSLPGGLFSKAAETQPQQLRGVSSTECRQPDDLFASDPRRASFYSSCLDMPSQPAIVELPPRPPPFFYARPVEPPSMDDCPESEQEPLYHFPELEDDAQPASPEGRFASSRLRKASLAALGVVYAKSVPLSIRQRLRSRSTAKLEAIANESFDNLAASTSRQSIVQANSARIADVPPSFRRMFSASTDGAPPLPPLSASSVVFVMNQVDSSSASLEVPELSDHGIATAARSRLGCDHERSSGGVNTPVLTPPPSAAFLQLPSSERHSQVRHRSQSCEVVQACTPDAVARANSNNNDPPSFLEASSDRAASAAMVWPLTEAFDDDAVPTVRSQFNTPALSFDSGSPRSSIGLWTPDMADQDMGCAALLLDAAPLDETTPTPAGESLVEAQVRLDMLFSESGLDRKADDELERMTEVKSAPGSRRSSFSSASRGTGDERSLIWPLPPTRTVVIDTDSGDAWQHVSPQAEFFPRSRSPPPSPRRRQSRLNVHFQHPVLLPCGTRARSLSESQVSRIFSSLMPTIVLTPMPDASPALPYSGSPSPDELAPRIAHRAHPRHGELHLHTHHHHRRHHYHNSGHHTGRCYKTDDADLSVPSNVEISSEEPVTFDAPRWSDLMNFCITHGDTALQDATATVPVVNGPPRQLHVCVWEVGEYGNSCMDADLCDPTYLRIEMTLKLRTHGGPRPDDSPCSAGGTSWSSASCYSDEDSMSPTLSASSSVSPTPPLSSTAHSGDSWTSPSPHSQDWTPDTTPQSPDHITFPASPELIPGANLLLSVSSPGGYCKEVQKAPVTAASASGSKASSTEAQCHEQLQTIPLSDHITGHLRRTLMLSFAVPLPSLLGQVGMLARQSSVGEGVDWI